jgi:hypothetical protein
MLSSSNYFNVAGCVSFVNLALLAGRVSLADCALFAQWPLLAYWPLFAAQRIVL